MTTKPAPPLALIAAVTAIGFSALHVVVPVLPVIAASFAAAPDEAQWVLTLYFVGIAAGQLFYGPVSDRFGRRPVLLAGLGLFLAGTLACAFAWSLPALVGGRVVQAIGGCAGLVIGRAIIRDVSDREGAARAIALVMMAMTLAPALSPAIGAYLTEWFGWRAIFAVLGALGAGALALTVRFLAETGSGGVRLDRAGLVRAHVPLLRSRVFAAFALCSACSSASWFTFIASAPYILAARLHQPPRIYGAMILIPMAAYMLGNAAAARLGRRLGSTVLFVAGLAISLASGALMAAWCGAALSAWALFVPMATSSIGNGLSQPAAFAAGLSVHPRLAGTASGLMGFLQMAVSALGTAALGALPRGSEFSTVVVVAAAQFLAMALGLFALLPARTALAIPREREIL